MRFVESEYPFHVVNTDDSASLADDSTPLFLAYSLRSEDANTSSQFLQLSSISDPPSSSSISSCHDTVTAFKQSTPYVPRPTRNKKNYQLDLKIL